ncbi:hypothetical protein Salat_2565200 [Sesamum alatum]|uniref:Uncharacterized protein n=1 Tax=Sesamum alatum TaxID=300844 RepID=A0AAE2CCU0_9LAMI|nr:hypothetical protein Salat_2565200 [Sesamum alatum]
MDTVTALPLVASPSAAGSIIEASSSPMQTEDCGVFVLTPSALKPSVLPRVFDFSETTQAPSPGGLELPVKGSENSALKTKGQGRMLNRLRSSFHGRSGTTAPRLSRASLPAMTAPSLR